MYRKTGKLISKEVSTGTGKASGKPWSKVDFVIDLTTDPKYPSRVKFESFKGALVELVQDTLDGTNIAVDFDVESRDWTNPQGKTIWFTSAKALSVEVVREENNVHQGNQSYNTPPPPPQDDPNNDLPF